MTDDHATMAVFTVEQVAKLLQVHIETVRRAVRSGDLRGFKVGTGWRFTQDDLRQFIEHQRPTRHAENTQ